MKKEQLKYLKVDEQKHNLKGFMDRHSITSLQRSFMVDWMIEVTDSFNCDHQTFFYSVSIMDRCFKVSQSTLTFDDLHLLGATSIFIASKFEDTKAITMKELLTKICHNEFTIDQIKEQERQILTVLDYDLFTPTSLDFLKVYLDEMFGVEILSHTKTQTKEKEVLGYHKSLLAQEEEMSISDEGNTDSSSHEG